MIVASCLLILVAVLFIALGLINGSSSLLITAIVTTLLAAVALVINTRQTATRRQDEPARRDPEFDEPVAFAEDSASAPAAPAGESRVTRSESSEAADADYADSDSTADSSRSAARSSGRSDEDEQAWRPASAAETADHAEQVDEFAEPDDDDPDDEPLPQSVRPADAVLVARFDTEVLVVDGRPRYHMADCPHLVGRLTEPLPVNEAVELGFSPCGLCRPVDRLVAAVAQQR